MTYYGRTNVKILIEKMKKPLLLAPQTYGPYKTDKSKVKAAKAIGGADCVLTRDEISMGVVHELVGKSIPCCADMAFILPYHDVKSLNNDKVKIGINVSKLLYTEGTEVQEKNFDLKTDYKEYITAILQYLTENDRYDIYI